jgi:hypothetical protein
LIDWEHIITASLTQVPPWPTFVDSYRYEPPNPPHIRDLFLGFCELCEKEYHTKLAADAFIERLQELEPSWPQVLQAERDFENEFEADLAVLGGIVARMYMKWDKLQVCERIKEKYKQGDERELRLDA